MPEQFDARLTAHILRDQDNRLRSITHSAEYWESEEGSPLAAAVDYLRSMGSDYEVPSGELDNLAVPVTHLDPRPQGVEYRLAEERQSFDSTTFGFDQTVLNTPVWSAGMQVTVKQGPNRVVQSSSTAHAGIAVELPPAEAIERYRRIFQAAEVRRARRAVGEEPGESEENEGRDLVLELTQAKPGRRPAAVRRGTRLIRGQFWIYQYDELTRLPSTSPVPERFNRGRDRGPGETVDVSGDRPPLVLPLPQLTTGSRTAPTTGR